MFIPSFWVKKACGHQASSESWWSIMNCAKRETSSSIQFSQNVMKLSTIDLQQSSLWIESGIDSTFSFRLLRYVFSEPASRQPPL
jgi:hypothetical protein